MFVFKLILILIDYLNLFADLDKGKWIKDEIYPHVLLDSVWYDLAPRNNFNCNSLPESVACRKRK